MLSVQRLFRFLVPCRVQCMFYVPPVYILSLPSSSCVILFFHYYSLFSITFLYLHITTTTTCIPKSSVCVCVFSFPLIVLSLHFSANAPPNAVVQPTCPSPPSFKHTHTYTHTLFHKSDNFYFCFCFLLHLSTCFRPETRGPTCSKPNQSINMIIWPFSHSFSHRNISFFVLLHSSVYEQN